MKILDRYLVREIAAAASSSALLGPHLRLDDAADPANGEQLIAKGVAWTIVAPRARDAAAAGARRHDPDGAAARHPDRPRPAVRRSRVRRAAGVRRQHLPAAAADRAARRRSAAAATRLRDDRRAAGRQPDVPRDHLQHRRVAAPRATSSRASSFSEFPEPRALRARHAAGRRLARRLPGRHARTPDQTTVYLREAAAGWSSTARSRRCELRARGRHAATRRRRRSRTTYEGGAFERLVSTSTPRPSSRARRPIKGDNEMTIAELRAERSPRTPSAAIAGVQPALHDPAEVLDPGRLPGAGADRPRARRHATARTASSRASSLGFGVVFVYYIMLWTSRARRSAGRLPPSLAPWMPNLVLGAAGIVLVIWRARLGRSADPASACRRFWRRPATTASDAPAARRAAGRRRRVVVIVVRIPHLDLPAPEPARPVHRRGSTCESSCSAFVALLGIFYISTFIDLADKLFRGAATTRHAAALLLFRDAAVRVLHHPDVGAGRDARRRSAC